MGNIGESAGNIDYCWQYIGDTGTIGKTASNIDKTASNIGETAGNIRETASNISETASNIGENAGWQFRQDCQQ